MSSATASPSPHPQGSECLHKPNVRTETNGFHTWVVAQLREGEALRRGPRVDQWIFICAAWQQTTALVDERLKAQELRLWGFRSHNWVEDFLVSLGWHRGIFFCSGVEAQPKRRANDFGLGGVVLCSGLLHGSSHLWLDIAEQSNRAFALRSECCFRHWIWSPIRYGSFLSDRQILCKH